MSISDGLIQGGVVGRRGARPDQGGGLGKAFEHSFRITSTRDGEVQCLANPFIFKQVVFNIGSQVIARSFILTQNDAVLFITLQALTFWALIQKHFNCTLSDYDQAVGSRYDLDFDPIQ